MKGRSDYDPFAWFYNRYWGESFVREMWPVVERLVLARLTRRARVLDLCCGTGNLAVRLAQSGFQVTGLDASAAMLRYARRNAPKVEFLRADVRRFRTARRYHAALSIFDSLNHILEPEGLRSVFRSVREALRPGGVFLFDLNTARTFRLRRDNLSAIVRKDHVCVVRRQFAETVMLARWRLTLFRLRGNEWRRENAAIFERCYAVRDVKSALRSAGFGRIQVFNAEADLGMKGHPGRRVFLARRDQG